MAIYEPITADLRVRLLHPAATAPRRAHEQDAAGCRSRTRRSAVIGS